MTDTKRPREFWINPSQIDKPLYQTYNLGDAPPYEESIHAREVLPINWGKIWSEYIEKDLLPSDIQQLVEKALRGEE